MIRSSPPTGYNICPRSLCRNFDSKVEEHQYDSYYLRSSHRSRNENISYYGTQTSAEWRLKRRRLFLCTSLKRRYVTVYEDTPGPGYTGSSQTILGLLCKVILSWAGSRENTISDTNNTTLLQHAIIEEFGIMIQVKFVLGGISLKGHSGLQGILTVESFLD